MQLIDADTAQAGLTILASEQTAGKGQRGKRWKDERGQSLLMTVVCAPECRLERQFLFSAAVANAVAGFLTDLYENWDVQVKWPNDIIINDKKAGGILIENVLRGNEWCYSVVGLGLNIGQPSFPSELPYATSLRMASGKDFSLKTVFESLRKRILEKTSGRLDEAGVLKDFNDYLYRKDCIQRFENGERTWQALVKGAKPDGTLEVQDAGGNLVSYVHGQVQWKWE